ncbi:MAG: hypothetical protein ACRC2H_01500 [Silanimonas sp.]
MTDSLDRWAERAARAVKAKPAPTPKREIPTPVRVTQGNGGLDGRPRCYNGEAVREYVANTGFADGVMTTTTIPWAFSRECKAWASDPSTDPVPMAEGWRCEGCRHYPEALVKLAVTRQQQRRFRSADD